MDPLSATASIIAILQLSAKVLTYLNDVKDASKDRVQCAVEASNLNTLLLNLRFRLEEGGSIQPWYTAVRALAVENGPLDQYKQALDLLQSRMTEEGSRLKKAGDALVWKFRKEEIASILDRMERLKTLVQIALQMDDFKLSQAIKDDTIFVRTRVPTIQAGIDTVSQNQDQAKHCRLLEWVSPTAYPAQQSDIIKRRQEGTGQWFLDEPEVARWLSESKGTLFCPGIPGAGKTMVAAIAIDHLLKSAQKNLYGVAYVYCNYKAQEEQDASSMLAAILKQLVQARPSTMESMEWLHKQHSRRGTKPSLDEIFRALQDVLARYTTVHIVIDALDECRDSTRRQFLAKLRDLQAGRDLRLMVTSRFIPEIVNTFKEASWLEVQASKEDVKRFVAGQVDRLPRCIQRNPELQKMVENDIAEAVDGMFLLARLHVDTLLDKTTTKDVKSTLAKLSKGSAALDDAYKVALQRIESQLDGHHKLAKKVLLWITFAKRPLTTAEICCALAVEPEEEELDRENIPDIEDLVSVCAGLVVVDQESAIVRLVHYTTQEYFERMRATWNPGAQLEIVTTCLTYLSFGAFRSGSCSTDEEFYQRLQQNEFLDYAAMHWGEHAREIECEVSSLASTFLFEDSLLSCATQVLSAPKNIRYRFHSQHFPGGTNLHYTSQFGLTQITKDLLRRTKEKYVDAINMTDTLGRTPLVLAAGNGHDETAKLLLDKGADINGQGRFYRNALQEASFQGHEQVVKLLLEKNADVNAQGGEYGNALQAASFRGHEQVVKLLLEKNADVNAQGGYYGNALQAALFKGH
ncbi:ankyrin, partial [Delitschia confertaspora ATCC 74209]